MNDQPQPNAPAGGRSDDPNMPHHADAGAVPDDPNMPNYKGAPLDAERGPGLGCFWIQVVVLVTFLILTPLTVTWAWPSWISALMLIIVLVLLLFVGQTTIFLLRLVAADRRTARRRPMSPTARKTVGDLEEEAAATDATGDGSQEDHAGTG